MNRVNEARKMLFGAPFKLARLANLDAQRRLTDERILNSLKKLGVSTQSEVEVLRLRVEHLEEELAKLTMSITKPSMVNKKSKSVSRRERSAETEA